MLLDHVIEEMLGVADTTESLDPCGRHEEEAEAEDNRRENSFLIDLVHRHIVEERSVSPQKNQECDIDRVHDQESVLGGGEEHAVGDDQCQGCVNDFLRLFCHVYCPVV